jgi:hypothetical protein
LYFQKLTWKTCLKASGIVKLAIPENYFPRHTHMQRTCSSLSVQVEALAEFWNVCLACPTAANENVGAGHMAKILHFFLIPLSVSVRKMAFGP